MLYKSEGISHLLLSSREQERVRGEAEGRELKKDSRCSYLPCEAMHASCIEEVALFD